MLQDADKARKRCNRQTEMLGGMEAAKKVFIGWLSLIAFQQVIQSSIPKTEGQTEAQKNGRSRQEEHNAPWYEV